MRVAIVVGAFPALSETFILNHIKYLVNIGNEVDIYARIARDDKTVHPEVYNLNLLSRTTYNREPRTFFKKIKEGLKILINNKDPKLIKLLNPEFPEARSGQLLFAGNSIYHKKYDVIHCHYGPNGNVFSLLKELGFIPFNTKIITTFHGYDLWSEEILNKKDFIYNSLKKMGDHYIAISPGVKEKLINDFQFEKSKIEVIPNGVDLNKFTFLEKLPQDKLKILMVSRISPEKGIKQALDSLKILEDQYKITNYEFNLIGDGDQLEFFRNYVKNLNLKGSVNILGGRDQTSVISYMSKSNLLILTSFKEVLPTVVIEAQARGLPVISTKVGYVEDLVDHNSTGWLVENNFPKLISSQIAKYNEILKSSPSNIDIIRRVAYKNIVENYSLDSFGKKIINLYK